MESILNQVTGNRRVNTLLVVLLVLSGRLIWFAYWGVLLEVDSLGYLSPHTALYHPPGYTAFCAAILLFTSHVAWIVVGQSLVYALSAAVLLRKWVPSGRHRLILAIALGIEPLSGQLSCTIMAETLFLAALFLVFAALHGVVHSKGSKKWMAAASLGVSLGLAEMIRYAAPAFLVGIVLWLLYTNRRDLKTWIAVAIMMVASSATILPLRIFYKIRFDTWQVNGFSGLSLWNSAAYLYPESSMEKAPRNDWERFLSKMPAEKFAIRETWTTNQIFHSSSAFQIYVDSATTREVMEASVLAKRTGRSLIIESPFKHLTTFVWPNILRPFTRADHIPSDRLWPYLPENQGFHFRDIHDYHPAWWWVYFSALIFGSIFAWRRAGRNHRLVVPILACSWLYLAGIGLLTVVFLRFVYLLAPLVVLAIGLQFVPGEEDASSHMGSMN